MFHGTFQFRNVEVYFRPKEGSFPRPADTSAVTPLPIVWLSDASTKDAEGRLIPPGEAPADNLPTETTALLVFAVFATVPLNPVTSALTFCGVVHNSKAPNSPFTVPPWNCAVSCPKFPRIQPSLTSRFWTPCPLPLFAFAFALCVC